METIAYLAQEHRILGRSSLGILRSRSAGATVRVDEHRIPRGTLGSKRDTAGPDGPPNNAAGAFDTRNPGIENIVNSSFYLTPEL